MINIKLKNLIMSLLSMYQSSRSQTPPLSVCAVDGCNKPVAIKFIVLGPRPAEPGLDDHKTSLFCQEHSCWHVDPMFKYALPCFERAEHGLICENHSQTQQLSPKIQLQPRTCRQ